MKKYLSILLLVVAGLATSADASRCDTGFTSRRNTYPMNIPGGTIVQPDVCCSKDCDCFPTVFVGQGSTLLGQTTDTSGAAVDNPSFMIPATTNYNAIHDCPSFQYNKGTRAQGSTAGRLQVATAANGVLWGGSDVFTDSNQDIEDALCFFPVVQAGVVVFYNAPNGFTSTSGGLELTKQDVANIFSGSYQNWDDIPDVTAPSTAIQIGVRGDGSGTTSILNQYLNSANGGGITWNLTGSGPFESLFAVGGAQSWSGATGGDNDATIMITQNVGTAAMIDWVTEAAGRIGYVGYNDILDLLEAGNTIAVASIQNSGGAFVAPSPATFSASLVAVENTSGIPCDLKINSVDPADAASDVYPIATPSFVIVKCCQYAKCQAFELRKFLYFLLANEQISNGMQGFGRVDASGELVDKYIAQISCIDSYECCIDNEIGKCCLQGKCPTSGAYGFARYRR